MSFDKLNINDGPSKFDVMTAYFMPVNAVGPSVRLSTGDKEGESKTFWIASIHSCEPIDGTREVWKLRGYASNRSGSGKNAPYEALYRTDKRTGWFMLLEGELFDNVLKETRFGELQDGDHFVLVGSPHIKKAAGGDPPVYKKLGMDARKVGDGSLAVAGMLSNLKVVRVIVVSV